MRSRKTLIIVLLIFTLLLGALAVYIAIQLQNQPNVGPGTPGASPASCCQSSTGLCGASCGGFDLGQACANGNWCWCARVTNDCPTDPNHSLETMCGTTAWDGNVWYSCPTGEQIHDNPEAFQDCGRCGTTTPPPTDVPTCPENPRLQYSLDGGVTYQNAGNTLTITDPNQQITFRMNNSIKYVITANRVSGNNVCSKPNNFAGVVNSPCPMTIPYTQGTSNIITTVVGRLYQDNGNPWSGAACRDRTTVSLAVTGTPTNTPTATSTPTGTPTNTPTGTLTPSVTFTNTPTPTQTPTPTLTPTPAVCGQPCGNGITCEVGHVCIDPGGGNRCVLQLCADTPSACLPDQCTPINPITVNKTASQACINNQNTIRITYSVVVTNPQASARTITVTDTLDTNIQAAWVVQSSITPPGVYSAGVITWAGVSLPASSSLTLNYQVDVPRNGGFGDTTNGLQLNNTVVVTESGTERGRDTYQIMAYCAPGTALISDQADRVLLAFLLMTLGILIYRFGIVEKIGNLFWANGGKHLLRKVNKNLEDQYRKEERSAYQKKIEKKISKPKK